MGVGKIMHYVGSVVLFVAMILAIVVSISAPVVRNISFVKMDLPGNADAQFGAFGYCYTPRVGTENICSRSTIGYSPAEVLERVDNTDYSRIRSGSTRALTHVFVLHPVGAGLLFLAFLVSLIAGSAIGGIFATLLSGIATIVNIVVMAVDFVVFRLVLSELEEQSTSGSGRYGVATWLALVVAILSILATLLMFVTCCAGRRRRSRESKKMSQY